MSNEYKFTQQPDGTYIVKPVGDAPPLKAGRCSIGYHTAYLEATGDPDRWVVWNMAYFGEVEFENTVSCGS